MKLPNWLLSSSGEGVALRWKSFAAGVVPLALLVAKFLGYDITPDAANEAVGIVEEIILWAWTVGSIWKHIEGWANRNFRKELGQGKFSSDFLA